MRTQKPLGGISRIHSQDESYNRNVATLIARRATPALIVGGLLMGGVAQAADFPVSTPAELIAAINSANDETANPGADSILLNGATITLTAVDNSTFGATGLPVITSEITIEGAGGGIVRDTSAATPNFRLLAINGTAPAAGNLTLNTSTISGGVIPDDPTESGLVDGGGIAVFFANLAVNNSTIRGNHAVSSGYGRGGGIFAYTSTTTVNNSTVSGNSASFGGGLYGIYGNTTLANTTVSGNTAGFLGGGFRAGGENTTLTNTTVSGNTSYIDGGGVDMIFGNITLTNTTVSGNTSNRYGGGLNLNFGNATLTNSTVSGNSSGMSGGGIYSINDLTDQTTTLTNSTVSGNSGNAGGGVFNQRGRTEINNSTISDNTSANGNSNGIYSYASNLTSTQVTASIISGNSTSDVSSPLNSTYSNPNPVNSFVSNGANVIGSGDAAGAFSDQTDVTGDTTSTSGSPVFGDLAFNGGPTQTHSISGIHPAGGNAAGMQCPPTDQRNVPRSSASCDAGAFQSGASFDLGDAPDPTFPTLLASNGAAHVDAVSSPALGSGVDFEAEGQQSANSDGDDTTGTDDEDGVTVTPNPLVIGQPATITVDVSGGGGLVNAWLDLNQDGDWNDTGEQIATDLAITSSDSMTFTVPANASPGNFNARVRISTAGGDTTTGVAQDGEVEDYAFDVVAAPTGGGGGTGGGGVTPPASSGGGGGGCALNDSANASTASDPLLWLMAMLAGLGLWRRKSKNSL